MQPIQAPPDATVFRSGELTPFLYLGATEAIALQIEWGLRGAPEDDHKSLGEKRVRMNARMFGHDFADRVTVLRVCLSQWAEQSGVDVSTDKKALKILERGEVPGETYGIGKKYGPLYRFNAIWERYSQDMNGLTPDEAEEEAAEGQPATSPKDQSASTQSETSSSPPSAGASPEKKRTGSRRARSASTSGHVTRPEATS